MRRNDFLIAIFVFVIIHPLAAGPGIGSAGRAPQSSGANSTSAQPPQLPPSDDSKPILKDGTPVRLRFTREVCSSKVLAGESIELQVAEEVKAGGVTVIAKDDVARATVVLAQAKRQMARNGNLKLRIEGVRLADGESARLRAMREVRGGDSTPALVSGMVMVGAMIGPPAMLLAYVKGDDVVIEKGSEMTAYVDGDVKIDVAKFDTNPGAKPIETGKDH